LAACFAQSTHCVYSEKKHEQHPGDVRLTRSQSLLSFPVWVPQSSVAGSGGSVGSVWWSETCSNIRYDPLESPESLCCYQSLGSASREDAILRSELLVSVPCQLRPKQASRHNLLCSWYESFSRVSEKQSWSFIISLGGGISLGGVSLEVPTCGGQSH
jgi:hypothetical protein